MAIIRDHIPYYLDVFNIAGFLKDPVLIFGFQDCLFGRKRSIRSKIERRIKRRAKYWMEMRMRKRRGAIKPRFVDAIPKEFQQENLNGILRNLGLSDIRTMDYFDKRADIVHDMNLPIDESLKGVFSTVIDIGSLEHVFDTKQCLWNLFRLLKVNGHLLLHTPCNGYFNHGFHTFSPECVIHAVKMNGFEVKYLKYSTPDGFELERPDIVSNAILWIAAEKKEGKESFVIPQQGCWRDIYKTG